MGSAQSYLPVAAVVVGAAAYGYVQLQQPSAAAPQHAGPFSSSPNPASTSASSAKKQKQKKKGGAGAGAGASEKQKDARPAQPNVVAFPLVVPGSFDAQSPAIPSETQPKPKKAKKKVKKAFAGGGADAQSESSATAPESSAAVRMTKPKKGAAAGRPAALEDGGWTKVETKKKPAKAGAAVAGEAEGSGSQAHGLEVSTSDLATSVTTGNSSPVTERTEDESQLADSISSENRRTLAERLLPKPRKTGVEDLLEEPDYPEVSRVMRIKPRPDEQPAAGFSWEDYEDVDSRAAADDADGEDDGGWGVVKSRGRQRVNKAPSDTCAPTAQKSTEALTKKQRQHAAKREAQKAAKTEAEQDRLATFAKHKRDLERARMAEQAKTTKKTASGGMSAYVDENGKLVWQ